MATEVPFTSPYGIEVTNLTEPVPILYGGTGKATQQDAINALVGTQTANRVLRSNGTNMSLSQVTLSTDVTGTLPIANGGTGSTTASAARSALGAAASGTNNDITTMTAVTTIAPVNPSDGAGASITIRAEAGSSSYSGYAGGSVTIQSGVDGDGYNGTGQNIIMQIGSASPSTGSNFIVRHNASTERFRINKNGAWGLSGENYGTSGQILTSNGNTAPSWSSIDINISGGSTGLTTSGGPITSTTGTITLGGALNASNGGTGYALYSAGDMLYATGATTLSKLSIGSDGQVLILNNGLPTWGNAPAAGSAAADLLSGTELASNVVTSSLTSVGTLSSLAVSGSITFGTAYSETSTDVTSTSTTIINCALGNNFNVTLASNITSLSFTNVPESGRVYNLSLFLTQDNTGSRVITWPQAVKWPSGNAPTLTTTATKTDIITLVTFNGGTTWFGFTAGQNY